MRRLEISYADPTSIEGSFRHGNSEDEMMAWAAQATRAPTIDKYARLARLRRLAWLIDGAFQLPGTRFRFGLNSILGLLPFGGDLALGAISLYIVYEATQLGIPRKLLLRMLANVALEVTVGSVPIIGDLFDVLLKANLRNIALIEKQVDPDSAFTARSPF